MKYSFNWLSEYVKLPEISKLRGIIEAHSFEVEAVEEYGRGLDGKIVVAEVVAWDKHPNADRLRVVTLKLGAKTVGPVVCGASNFNVGDKVCLALPGAIIPRDQHSKEPQSFTLEKANIRGVESEGMICSAYELGLGDDRSGILILPQDATLGSKASAAIGDYIIDVNTQATNRADVQSYLGFALELSAITGRIFKQPKIKPLLKKSSSITVTVENKTGSPRYMGALIRDLKVGPSPAFIQSKLIKHGIRPINNIVDITSYVMLELGLPLHVFDAEGLSSVVVRDSRAGEKILTLADDKERQLPAGILLITDKGETPIAVAGVVGSRGRRAVGPETKDVFLEAAKFDPILVRTGSRSLGLHTDASARFQKDLSIHLPPLALSRAVELIVKYGGGKFFGAVDTFPQKAKLSKTKIINLPVSDIERLLGLRLEAKDVKKILSLSGFKVSFRKSSVLIGVPHWRTDIKFKEDLIEEIGRINGYDKIPDTPPSLETELKVKPGLLELSRRDLEDNMAAFGFYENKNYAFISDHLAKDFGFSPEDLIEITNPIDVTSKYLRPSLLPILAKTAVVNFRKYNSNINYFELGQVFSKIKLEKTNLAALSVGHDHPQDLLSIIKGALQALQKNLGLPQLTLEQSEVAPLNIGLNTGGKIKIENQDVGVVGLLSPILTQKVGLKNGHIAFVEIYDLEKFLSSRRVPLYEAVPRFPAVYLDLTFVVDEKITWQAIEENIKNVNQDNYSLINRLELIDIFRDEKKIGAHKKSLTIGLSFQHPERTLETSEVESVVEKIKQRLLTNTQAIIR